MSAILFTVVIILFITLVIGLYQKSTNEICKSKRRLDGKTALVTGGTMGMGLEIAKDFAERGAKVIIACPWQQEGERGRQAIVDSTGSKQVIFKLLDLAKLKSVRELATDILNTEERLDILINNAGVGRIKDVLTDDGLQLIMQINYFGHFLLTLLLLPLLKKSGRPSEPSGIVNTSSILHWFGKVDVKHINKTNYWYDIQKYGNSKYCMIPFSRELTRRLTGDNVVVNSVDPGLVGTRIYECLGKACGMFIALSFRNLFKSPWEGAQTSIHVAVDTEAGKVSGEFFKNCKLSRAKKSAYDDETARILFDESVRLVKLTDEELKTCFS